MQYEKEFTQHLIKDRNASEATVSAYVSDVGEFGEYLAVSRAKPLIGAGSADVAAYVMDLKSMDRSSSTINRKMSSVRCYYQFLMSAGLIKESPAEGIKSPKIVDKEIDYLSIEDTVSLIESPGDDAKGLRDRALLELMYATGMRAGEICAADVSDMDLRIGFISVTKGRVRVIPVGKPAKAAMKRYLEESRPILTKESESSQALFVNIQGERITRQGIWKLLKFYAAKVGIEKTISPQVLRNSFAVHMLSNGADLRSVQDLMGLEDINAAKLYMVVGRRRIMDVYDKTHPRA